MKLKIYCNYCKKIIKQRDNERDTQYAKRKYHAECKYKGMRKNGSGFFGEMNKPFPIAKVHYVRGHMGEDMMHIENM